MPRSLFVAAALLPFLPIPALADLTAADVWADWQAIAANSGQTLSATSEAQTGRSLVVSGVSMTTDMPEGSLTGNLGDLTFTENGDGTVSIEMPVEFPMTFSGESVEGEPFSIAMLLSQSDLQMTASGTPGDTQYVYEAVRLTLSADAIEAAGESVPFDLDMSMTAMAGDYAVRSEDAMTVTSNLNAGGIAFALSAEDPQGSGEQIGILATLSDFVSTSQGSMPSFTAMAGLGEMIEDGLTSDARVSYANGRYEISGNADGQQFDLRAEVGEGAFDVTINEDGLDYGGRNADIRVSAQSSALPLPDASMALESTEWQFAMPFTVSDEPKDFNLVLKLNGLTISDMLWSMVDPMGGIPRDPATLIVDLAGQGNWLFDITDPDIAEAELDGMPGELHAVTINELRLDVAGAELTGTGDFTFDNSAMPPAPSGTANLSLTGGYGLLDTLVGMGLVPQEQAMGARMMLGLLARPGEGDDTLVSTIELTPEGGILANGQPLR